MQIGQYHTLTIDRETSVGIYLTDEEGRDVLLPNKYCPESYSIGDLLKVFVYLDNQERIVATTLEPKIQMHTFALLRCADSTEFGAFMDWGLEKHLLVPFSDQKQTIVAGKWYIVYLDIDEETNRLYGSQRIEKHLQNFNLSIAVGDEVDLMVYRETDIGFAVIINNKHKGLVFKNEVFQPIHMGDKMRGYVKKIGDENKIDISLQPIGYKNFNSKNSEAIYEILRLNNGWMAINDKSAPEIIYNRFGISKKAFKKAIGDLYKQRLITIEKDGIRTIENNA